MSPRTVCPATTGLRSDVGKGRACPTRLLRRRTPPFGQGRMPCPTSSDRRRPSASQHRRPRRARWSFPSYSPESLPQHSTIGSGDRSQISFSVLQEVAFVALQGDFTGIVFRACSRSRFRAGTWNKIRVRNRALASFNGRYSQLRLFQI